MPLFSFISSIGIIQALCFIVGLGLVILEFFYPGFGAPGIVGLILLAVGVVLTAKTAFEALILVIIILVLLGIALFLVLHSASKGRLSRTLILSEALDAKSGFSGTDDLKEYLGKEGESITPLRPAGIAIFDGVKLDVVTEGEYIPANTRVKIIAVSGRRIVVREVK